MLAVNRGRRLRQICGFTSAQHRQYAVAQLIARVRFLGVKFVESVHVVKADITLQRYSVPLRAKCAKAGRINSAAPRRNAPCAVRPHAARQVQKQCFGVIVGVVRRGDTCPFRPQLPPQSTRTARAARIPPSPSRRLRPQARAYPYRITVAVKLKRLYSTSLHELRVAVGLRAANAVVHMHRVQTLRAVASVASRCVSSTESAPPESPTTICAVGRQIITARGRRMSSVFTAHNLLRCEAHELTLPVQRHAAQVAVTVFRHDDLRAVLVHVLGRSLSTRSRSTRLGTGTARCPRPARWSRNLAGQRAPGGAPVAFRLHAQAAPASRPGCSAPSP
jgi:hypothetical protein